MASGVNSSSIPLYGIMTASNLLFQYETLKYECLSHMCSCGATNMFPGAAMLPECCHDTYAVLYFSGVFLIKNNFMFSIVNFLF